MGPTDKQLGAFVLHNQIAEGGMGTVWSATHREIGTRVAVKVINVEGDHKAAMLRQVRREVSAVATLDHPGIVLVYDQGELPAGVHPSLPAGSPYLVMEWASLGALDEAPAPTSWHQVLGTTSATLEALAHAHARGVIHRDLKPANLLLCGPEDDRPGLKLADFGLAMDVSDRAVGLRRSGTPHYMAPEQFQGRWRDYGPALDLYALGCMVWEWVTGRPPFDLASPHQLSEHHQHAPVPKLLPRMAVPDGLDDWLRWLLQKDHRERPLSCADARLVLERLPSVEADSPSPNEAWRVAGDTMPPTLLEADESQPSTARGAASISSRATPTLPTMWQERTRPRELRHLPGAGGALFHHRVPPVVGQDETRARLWGRAVTAARTGRLQVTGVWGAAGTGRSRMVRWLSELCHEVGGALTLWATPEEGLQGMLIDAVRGWRMDEVTLAERCAGLVPAEYRDDAPIIAKAAITGDPLVAAIVRLIVARSRRWPGRLQIIVLDGVDAIAGSEALAQALTGLDDARSLPVLMVAIGGESRPLSSLTSPQEPALQPLTPVEMQQLVAELLPVSPSMAARLGKRSQGLPGYALSAMQHVVEQGWLRQGPAGFELPEGRLLALPERLRAVDASRMHAFLGGRPVDDMRALQLAAVLGHGFDDAVWRRGLRIAELQPSPGLLDDTVQRGLARVAPGGGWSLSTGVRDALEAEAERDDKLASTCRIAAEAIGDTGHPGMLLVRAGDLDKAIVPLLEEALARGTSLRITECVGLVSEAESCARAVSMPDEDPRWGFILGMTAYSAANTWMVDRLIDGTARLVAWARRHERPEDLARGLRLQGATSFRLGEFDLALVRLSEALALYRQLGPSQNHMVCETLLSIGHTHRGMSNYATAMDIYEQVRELSEAGSTASVRSKIYNAIGDLLRWEGKLDEAWQAYQRSMDLGDESLAVDRMISLSNQGLVILARGDLHEAREWFEDLREQCERFAWANPLAFTHIALLPIYAELRSWDTYARTAARARKLMNLMVVADEDLGICLLRAARTCVDIRRVDEARLTLQMAIEQLESARQPERLAEARALMNALPG